MSENRDDPKENAKDPNLGQKDATRGKTELKENKKWGTTSLNP
jgi:hypothetical protein